MGVHLFWGSAGLQGMVWAASALILSWLLGRRQQSLALLGALGAFLVSSAGLGFQFWLADATSIPVYLLRVALGAGSAVLFRLIREDRLSWARWTGQALMVLSLAPLGLGYAAAGLITSAGSFPAAVMAGLALDLAQGGAVPMTAVLCLCWGVGMIPGAPRYLRFVAPGAVYLLMMGLCGGTDAMPALTLALGAAAGALIPTRAEAGGSHSGKAGADGGGAWSDAPASAGNGSAAH